MAGIKEIANKAGVSTCTVSKYINGKLIVKKSTAERIDQAIAELGYYPNKIAKALKTNQSNSIAVIVPTINNIIFPEMVAGINSVLKKNGYSMFLNTTENLIANEVNIVRQVIENCMAGVIVIGLPLDFVNNNHITNLKNKKIPAVLVYREFKPTIFPVVFPDFFKGGKIAIEHLLEQQRKEIGIIIGSKNQLQSVATLKGCEAAFHEHNKVIDKLKIKESYYTYEKAYKAAEELIKQGIDAIFALGDLMAIAAMKALQKNKIRIPEDVAVLGFGNTLLGQLVSPELTTIDLQTLKLGEKSAEIIMDEIKGIKYKNLIKLPISLIKRDSA